MIKKKNTLWSHNIVDIDQLLRLPAPNNTNSGNPVIQYFLEVIFNAIGIGDTGKRRASCGSITASLR